MSINKIKNKRMKTVTRRCPWTERVDAEARRGLPRLDSARRQVQGFILVADFGDMVTLGTHCAMALQLVLKS